jgi:aminoglycoside phosphotransferase (APT) family kinase protein
MTSGDPAGDLSVAWMLLPAACHDDFRGSYAAGGNAADDSIWIRARGWALAFSLVFLAHSADDPLLTRVGQQTMDTVLA